MYEPHSRVLRIAWEPAQRSATRAAAEVDRRVDRPCEVCGECGDLAITPMTSYTQGFRHRAIRRERLLVALGEGHALACSSSIELSDLRDQRFEIWPREMAPGFYDTVVGASEPPDSSPSSMSAPPATQSGRPDRPRARRRTHQRLTQRATSRGIKLVDLVAPQATLTIDAVWNEGQLSIVERTLDAAAQLPSASDWL